MFNMGPLTLNLMYLCKKTLLFPLYVWCRPYPLAVPQEVTTRGTDHAPSAVPSGLV